MSPAVLKLVRESRVNGKALNWQMVNSADLVVLVVMA